MDKIKNKELKIIHCPTEELVSDYNSKPLQGKLFYKHHNTIMGTSKQTNEMSALQLEQTNDQINTKLVHYLIFRKNRFSNKLGGSQSVRDHLEKPFGNKNLILPGEFLLGPPFIYMLNRGQNLINKECTRWN